MFVAGTSTRKVGEVAQTLMGVAPSGSRVSRLNQTLIQPYEAWRERRLQEHWRIVYLDGVHFDIRHGDTRGFNNHPRRVGSGSLWEQEKKEDALLNLTAFKAKYSQRYP